MGVFETVFRKLDKVLCVYLTDRETSSFEMKNERLLFLLRKAIFKTGYLPDTRSFRVEIKKNGKRGTKISFYPASYERVILKPLVFMFSTLNGLYDAAEKVLGKNSLRIFKSDLFFCGGYILIIYPIAPLPDTFLKDMSEFGVFRGASEIKASYYEEHGALLARGNAVEKLCL